jgi:hypothetical protein
MPLVPLSEVTDAISHEPSLLSGEGAAARESQPHAGAGGIAPVSVTSATPEVLGLSSHPAGWAGGGSQLHPQSRSPRTTAASGGDAHDGSAPGSSSSGAQASTSAGASTTTSTSNHLDDDPWLQEILTYDFLYKDLNPPKDPPASAAPTAPAATTASTVAPHDPQPGTSAASASRGTRRRVSLEAVVQHPGLKSGQPLDLKYMTPDLRFKARKLPVTRRSPESRAVCMLSENREYVAKQVGKVLMRSGYRIDHWGLPRLPMLRVTDLASGKKFRVFVKIASQNKSYVPRGHYVEGSDVLAQVTINPVSQALESLYFIRLEP